MQFLADGNTICNIQQGAGKIPFICFDLAGGANIAGSNVLVGKEGGQLDFLSTQGYSKQGLPGDMLPNNATTDFINEEFGLMFHADSAFLRGMLEKTSATTRAGVNGAVIAARSENDTGNNPHNPMYGIAQGRLARRAADADRLAELRLRRQLDGAGDADGSGESPDQGRSRLGCERPGRHRRARHAVHAAQRSAGHGLHGRGHGADGAHQRTKAAEGRSGDRGRRAPGDPGEVRLREDCRHRRSLRQSGGDQPGARSGHHRSGRRVRRRTSATTANSRRPPRS